MGEWSCVRKWRESLGKWGAQPSHCSLGDVQRGRRWILLPPLGLILLYLFQKSKLGVGIFSKIVLVQMTSARVPWSECGWTQGIREPVMWMDGLGMMKLWPLARGIFVVKIIKSPFVGICSEEAPSGHRDPQQIGPCMLARLLVCLYVCACV